MDELSHGEKRDGHFLLALFFVPLSVSRLRLFFSSLLFSGRETERNQHQRIRHQNHDKRAERIFSLFSFSQLHKSLPQSVCCLLTSCTMVQQDERRMKWKSGQNRMPPFCAYWLQVRWSEGCFLGGKESVSHTHIYTRYIDSGPRDVLCERLECKIVASTSHSGKPHYFVPSLSLSHRTHIQSTNASFLCVYWTLGVEPSVLFHTEPQNWQTSSRYVWVNEVSKRPNSPGIGRKEKHAKPLFTAFHGQDSVVWKDRFCVTSDRQG